MIRQPDPRPIKQYPAFKTGEGRIGAATGGVPYRVLGDDVEVTLAPPRILGPRRVALDDRAVVGVCIDMGNPHFVVFDDAQDGPLPDLARWALAVELHPSFPGRTNVEQVTQTPQGFAVRVWERGVGETLACGSGACAVAVAALTEGRATGGTLTLTLPGGPLSVSWAGGAGDPVHLRGGAQTVFSGIWGGTRETSP